MDDNDEIDGLTVLGDVVQENTNCLRYDILELVNKIRKIVKIFKRSPLKNEILQRYVRGIPCQVNQPFHQRQSICLKVGPSIG